MNLLRTTALILPFHIGLTLAAQAESHDNFASDAERTGYALGVLQGNELGTGAAEYGIDPQSILDGMSAGLGLEDSLMTLEEAQAALKEGIEKVQAERAAEAAAAAAERAKMAEAFMAENAQKEGVTTTDSGLQYRIVTPGEGDSPTAADTVKVHYTGRLLDGTVFDSSVEGGTPATFGVTQVIPGWTEALLLMKPGAVWEVWLPSEIAYGARGAGRDIGPNETLNFDIELLEVIGK